MNDQSGQNPSRDENPSRDDQSLNDFEARLRAFCPDDATIAAGTARDRLMYEAGRAAGRAEHVPNRQLGATWHWPLATGVAATLAVMFATLYTTARQHVAPQPAGQIVHIQPDEPALTPTPPPVEPKPEPNKATAAAPLLTTHTTPLPKLPANPWHADYLSLRRVALARGIESLASPPPTSGSAALPYNEPVTVAELMQELLGENGA